VVRRAEPVDAGHELFPAPVAFNVPRQASSLNDVARFLGGLPAAGSDTLAQLRHSSSWGQHQTQLDSLWATFNTRHEAPIRSWAASHIGDLQGARALFYPFSGPDFLFANAFFPHADTIVLCGLEPCEPLPPLATLSEDEMASGLSGLQTSITTVMQFSFFITKDMRHDLVNTRFRGVLPVILTFMAREGHQVDSIDLVKLDGAGNPVLVGANSGSAPGLLIRCRAPNGAARRVFYFKQDLSDGGMSPGGPFARFVSALGHPPAFVKSASYLMHEEGFSSVRNFLLNNCQAIVQDPSGVPYKSLLGAGWRVQLYGNYHGTLDMFAAHQQQDLILAYGAGQGQHLDFGVGYMYNPEDTCLMVAHPGRRR
jgi:hypothetical protein